MLEEICQPYVSATTEFVVLWEDWEIMTLRG
jgi:hypothetical protein